MQSMISRSSVINACTLHTVVSLVIEMRNKKYQRELEVAMEAAHIASRSILSVYHRGDVRPMQKSDSSPVTVADMEADLLILSHLKQFFPDDGYLSEETEDDFSRLNKSRVWVIDPLDGTREFIRQNGDFSVNIALVENKRPVVGVVLLPVFSETYYAIAGEGAYLQKDGTDRRLQVNDSTENLRMLRSRSRVNKRISELFEANERVTSMQKVGSARKGCIIARGDAELYYSIGYTMEWDTAAMELIVEEAGGIFRQMDGSVMLYNREDPLNRLGFYIINREENALL